MTQLTADDLNRLIPMPPDTWALDFRPSHVVASGLGDPYRQLAQAREGPAFTLIHRGRVAAVWGLVIPWPGLAEGWLVGNPEVLKGVRFSFSRGATRFCEAAHERLGLNRIQVHVQIANGTFRRWAQIAGFELEAELKGYWADGSPVLLMARTWR